MDHNIQDIHGQDIHDQNFPDSEYFQPLAAALAGQPSVVRNKQTNKQRTPIKTTTTIAYTWCNLKYASILSPWTLSVPQISLSYALGKTVCFSEQTMSAEKYPNILPCHMEVIVYVALRSLVLV